MGVFGFLFKYSWMIMILVFYFVLIYWAGYVPYLPQMQPLIDHDCCMGICKNISTSYDCFGYSNINRTVTCSPYDLEKMFSIHITNVSERCFLYWNYTNDPIKSLSRQGTYAVYVDEENLSIP
ncbi:MAG: hypothetical protein MUP55_03280 [Candidatus Aenigmarchaeota archaeon]|nr:hypothetical protein [Candidatus Aenigmarchaeota archaeon]